MIFSPKVQFYRRKGLRILMLKTSEIRVVGDLNFVNVTKEIKNDFLAGEARTDIAVRSFTDDDITIRSVWIINNQHRHNLEILQQVYQMGGPVRNEDSGGGTGGHDDSEKRLIRAF